MKRPGRVVVAVLFAAVVAAPEARAQGALQEKLAAAKQAAATNQQALRSYSWIEKTQLSLRGEVKNEKIEQCRYGPDGTVQKTLLSSPPEPPQKKRGVRGRVIAKKTGEMKAEMEAATALVHQYLPPAPDKMQVVMNAGTASLAQAGPGAVALRFPGYLKAGDSLTLTFGSAIKALQRVDVDTWLDDPSNRVGLKIELQSLPDGTNYPATTMLSIPARQIEVRIANSSYQKVAN